MNIVELFSKKVMETAQAFIQNVYQSIPNILLALLILVLGVLVGKALRKAVSRLLYKLGIGRATKVTGFDATLERLGYSGTTVDLLADLVKFFIYVVTLALAADALNLQVLVKFFQDLYTFLPRIIGFVIVLVVGLIFSDIIATFFERLITSKASKQEQNLLDFGKLVGNFSKLFLILIVVIVSLYVLGITLFVLEITYAVALIGLIALMVLGTKDIFSNYMAGVIVQGKFKKSRINIAGHKGKIKEVGNFYTTVQSKGKDIVIPNSEFMKKTIKKK